jgi:hypothetical protein
MGVLPPGSAHARPSAQPPINTSGNFPAHVSAVTFLKFPHFPVKIRSFWGVSKFCFLLESSYFCYLGAHAKFQIPMICRYWGLATATRKEKRKICKIMAYGCQKPSAQRRSDQLWRYKALHSCL